MPQHVKIQNKTACKKVSQQRKKERKVGKTRHTYHHLFSNVFSNTETECH